LLSLLTGASVIFGLLVWWIAAVVCTIPFDWPPDFGGMAAKSRSCGTSGGLTALVGTVAAWAATVGWLIQRHTNHVLARKQHTMNMLMNMRNSELLNNNRIKIRSRYAIKLPLTVAQVREFDAEYLGTEHFGFDEASRRAIYPPGDSVIFYLNYLEAIAVSVLDGDLDEEMIRTPLEPTFKSAVRRFWPLLRTDLNVRTFGDDLPSPNEVYAKLYLLVLRWGLTSDDVETFNQGTRELVDGS
jgi:hypothetical protein